MPSTTIVALPAADEAVWDLSSETKPHMTLLHLDTPLGTDVEGIIRHVQHAAALELFEFGLSVDKRGTLGIEDADVLFFDTEFGIPGLREFRANLLKFDEINKSYVRGDQFPGWIPHLTMGYPGKPAKEPSERQEHGLRWINFDRIAVWTGNYSGPEFELRRHGLAADVGEGYWSEEAGVHIKHYGVKGMRWGVRRDAKKLGGAAALAKAKVRDQAWAAKVEANPKLGKVSAKAAREARRLTKKLKKDYKEKGYNLKKDALARSRYDAEMKDILQNSLDKAAFKVHKNSPSRLSEVAIHRHPDGSITAIVQPRHNRKLVKQKGQIAKRDAKTAAREAKDALRQDAMSSLLDELMHELEDADGLYDGMQFYLEVDDEGYVDDISVEGEDLEQSDEDLDEELAHFGVKGMRWGVRRRLGPDGLVRGSVEDAIKKGQTPKTDQPAGKKGKNKQSADHQKAIKNLQKDVQNLSTDEIKQITARLKAVNEFNAITKAQKEAKRGFVEKVARWAGNAAFEGAKSKGESYIKELVGDQFEQVSQQFKGTTEGVKRSNQNAREKATKEARDNPSKGEGASNTRQQGGQKSEEKTNTAPNATVFTRDESFKAEKGSDGVYRTTERNQAVLEFANEVMKAEKGSDGVYRVKKGD